MSYALILIYLLIYFLNAISYASIFFFLIINIQVIACTNYYSAYSASTGSGVAKDPMSKPQDIYLDTINQWVYYTDSEANLLKRVKYDGSKSQKVIIGYLVGDVGLDCILYWIGF